MVKYNLTCIGWVRFGVRGGGGGGGGGCSVDTSGQRVHYRDGILMGFDTMMHCVS